MDFEVPYFNQVHPGGKTWSLKYFISIISLQLNMDFSPTTSRSIKMDCSRISVQNFQNIKETQSSTLGSFNAHGFKKTFKNLQTKKHELLKRRFKHSQALKFYFLKIFKKTITFRPLSVDFTRLSFKYFQAIKSGFHKTFCQVLSGQYSWILEDILSRTSRSLKVVFKKQFIQALSGHSMEMDFERLSSTFRK